jgi:tripartite-type tricarboxylate transporter receptor subunit TctC
MATDVSRSRRALTLAAGAAALAGPWITTARAADYPGGPLRIVVPYRRAGSTTRSGAWSPSSCPRRGR